MSAAVPLPSPAALGFHPADPAFIADPYPALRVLRDRHRVVYDERSSQWLVFRHDDVNSLIRDRRLGRSYLHETTHEAMGRKPPPAWHEPFTTLNGNGMLDREPPDHTRLRRLVLKAFVPATVETLRPRIQAIVDGLVDRVAGAGEFDLNAEIAEPLPVTVTAELLGIPADDRFRLRRWSNDICLMYELNPSDENAHRAVRASAEFSSYLRDLVGDRRRRPGGDLICGLLAVVDQGDQLTEDELIGTCALLLNAGHEASVSGAGNGWWSLFRNPDQLDRLKTDPRLALTAIHELLRYETPLPLFERWVLEDLEIGGIRIARGQEIALQFASANRDPAAFDDPDRLDVGRHPNPSLAFGAGIHYCLRAALARLELRIAFTTILQRLPRIQLLEPPTWKPTYVQRGLTAMRVRS